MKWFLKLSLIMKIVVVIVAIVLLVIIYSRLKGFFSTVTTRSELEGKIDKLKSQGEKQNYSDNQYKSWANSLDKAMRGLGTDNDAVMKVFKRMKNELDVININKNFGVRDNENLGEWLYQDGVAAMVNKQLTTQGINWQY